MLVFGIDQGLAHLGYSILEVEFKKKCTRKNFIKIYDGVYIKIIESGCLLSYPNKEFTERLFKLITKLENKILEYEPDFVCCERLFFSPPAKGSRNKSSSIMTTNMVTGNIAYICGKHKIPFDTYSPTKVKKNLCGNGKAQKEDVINKIKEMFKLDSNSDTTDHICDSIAIGLAHIFSIIDTTEEA